MPAPQTELIDETGRVVFRGTQFPPGGGSLPTGWTGDGGDPESVNSNGADLTVSTLNATNVEATGEIALNGALPYFSGTELDTAGGSIDTGGGDIGTGGGAIKSNGGAIDAGTGGVVRSGTGGHMETDSLIQNTAAGLSIAATGFLGFCGATPTSQQQLARPTGDAGALWDILNAFGFVVAP